MPLLEHTGSHSSGEQEQSRLQSEKSISLLCEMLGVLLVKEQQVFIVLLFVFMNRCIHVHCILMMNVVSLHVYMNYDITLQHYLCTKISQDALNTLWKD